VAIGVMLALSLGFGLLFLHYYTAFAAQATSLLFGNVLAVDPAMIVTLIGLALVTLAAMAAIIRPLIFASLQPKLAEANGVRLRFVSTAVLAIVALAVSESAQMSAFSWFSASWWGLPATAQQLVTGLWSGIVLSCSIALAEARVGHRPGLSHRLAGQLLHLHAERGFLFASRGWLPRRSPAPRAILAKEEKPWSH
jgi:zinc/manganese transport system permease protein